MPPLPSLTLAFAAGIAWANTWQLHPAPLAGAASVAALVAVLAWRAARRLLLVTSCVLALAIGAAWEAYERTQHARLLSPWLGRRVEVCGRVLDEPRSTASGRWMHRIQTEWVRWRDGEHPVCARLLLTTSAEVRFAAGERVRAAGILHPVGGLANFGVPDPARHYQRQHYYAILQPETPFVTSVGPAPLRLDRRLLFGLRDRMMAIHHRWLPPEHAALLNSLVFGSRAAPVGEQTERHFRRAGIQHVLVASGTQMTVVVGALMALIRARVLPAWSRVPLALLGVWGYGLMAGGGAPIVRAGVMAVMLVLAYALGREPHLLSALATAALVILGLDPEQLFDIGFQLSCAAVWGLLMLEPRVGRVLPGWIPAPVRRLCSASIAAQLGTAPLVAHHFCYAAPAGILGNLLAVPLAATLLAAGLATSFAGLASPWIARMCAPINLALLNWLLWGARACAAIPGGHLWVVPPGWTAVGICYLVLVALARLNREHLAPLERSRSLTVVTAAVIAALAGWRVSPRPPRLRVTFLDVGQGDSILVQTPSGRALLVDGGGVPGSRLDFGERVLLPALLHRGVRRLDGVVLTHAQADHCGGLPAVCRELRVGYLIDPALPPECPEAQELIDVAARRRIPRYRAEAGASWLLDRHTRLTILHPPEPRLTATQDDGNNNAVVLRVDYGRTSMLLPGDIEAEAEAHLVQAGMPVGVDVLKVAHHGSRTSTGEAFLERAAPRVAIVSAGRNNLFGHPSREVIRTLASRGVLLWRTDVDGAVEVVSDGQNLMVRGARAPSHWVQIPAH